MALIGKRTAIVSVGMSCQTAFQIYENLEFLAVLVGEPLEKHATPFDWTICAVRDVAGMIRDGETYPTEISELSGNRRPLWARRRCWFWHRVFGTPEKFFGQARYERERWDEIGERPNRHFFVSNTQNNLLRPPFNKLGIDTTMTETVVIDLSVSIRARFSGNSVLHAITHDINTKTEGHICFHRIAKDGSQWHGNKREWRQVFENALG